MGVEEAESIRNEKFMLSGALTRWTKQKLSAAFNKWKDALADARHQQYMMTQSLVSWCLRDLVKGFNTWRSVAYHWRLRQLQAEHKLRVKVKDAYPVEHWLPTALPHLTSPMKQLRLCHAPTFEAFCIIIRARCPQTEFPASLHISMRYTLQVNSSMRWHRMVGFHVYTRGYRETTERLSEPHDIDPRYHDQS